MSWNEKKQACQAQGKRSVQGIFFGATYLEFASGADKIAVERNLNRDRVNDHITARADCNIVDRDTFIHSTPL